MHTNKHANFFAPILICLVFGAAIVAMFPLVFQLSSVSPTVDYEDCEKMTGSSIQYSYPPVCVTKDGKTYTKNLPKIKMPEGQ